MKLALFGLLSAMAFAVAAEQPQPPKPQSKPCTSAPYRHFDFWLGSWIVHNKQGKQVGSSEITAIVNGCAISEKWTSVTPYRGVSYNFYDQSKNQWHQTWIGVDGAPLYLDGNLIDGKMVLKGQTLNPKGAMILQKITWTPLTDGRVSQHWQISKDNGQTWTDSFLGFYSKR